MDVRLPDGTVVKGIPDGTSRADLAQKLKSNGMNVPDEWLAPEPTPKVGVWKDIVAPSISNLVDIGRGVVGGSISLPGELSKQAQSGANWANKMMGGSPQFWSGKTVLPEYESTMAAIPRLGTDPTPQTKGFEQMGAVAAPFPGAGMSKLPGIARKAGGVVGKAGSAVGGAAEKVGQVVRDVRGVEVPGARTAAQSGAREALSAGAQDLGRTAGAKAEAGRELEGVVADLAKELDATKVRPADLATQGSTIRNAFSKVMESAKAKRTAAAEPLYDEAKTAAAAREASGARVDITSAAKPIEDLMALSENIPSLQGKLGTILSAIKGAKPAEGVAAPVGVGKITGRMKPPAGPTARPANLTYAELDLANRYIKDIAYSADVEGYGSVIRNAARDASKALDESIAKFVPEHRAAADAYRKLSEPMESLGTRFGRAMSETEGGLKGEAYTKVADQDIPARIFAKRDGVELMVDALSGGKGATPAARAAAQAQVDTMVENWILEGVRAGGKTGSKAAEAIAVPQMKATLGAVPAVQAKLGKQFGKEAGIERSMEFIGKEAEKRAASADIAIKGEARIKKALSDADAMAAQGGAKSQKQAYDGYVGALRSEYSAGVISKEKYLAALALIDRAATLEARTAKAQALAKKLIYGGAAIGAGYELKGLVQ
jgi:hypothetical protein